MKNFNTMTDDYHTSQSNLMGTNAAEQQQQQQQQHHQRPDEMAQDLNYLAHEAPLDGGESTFGAATSYSHLGPVRDDSVMHAGSDLMMQQDDEPQVDERQLLETQAQAAKQLDQLSPDNVDIQRGPLQQAGDGQVESARQQLQQSIALPFKPFLVSFMVDARGGAMRGRRHSGVRVIIPPNSAQMPTRITCRYLRRERLVHPPPLMEGEACASKIMEVGPAGAKFLAPVLIEVPHFASLRGNEREIIILRSDTGDVWREHLVEADDRLVDQIIASAQTSQQTMTSKQDDYFSDQENLQQQQQQSESSASSSSRRLTRIVTTEFPQYFAIISRIRQEDHAVGPSGTTVNSQVVPKVQAIFPQGALKKRIKIGLQNENSQDQQQQDDATNEQEASLQRSPSPQSGTERATSPAGGSRPGSAAAKRRSRFLACFGSANGSVDLLDNAGEDSSSDSPRQPCKELPVEKRFILGDVSDTESISSQRDPTKRLSRQKRNSSKVLETVPDNYYSLEEEPPLILNMEPKTYGKRLANTSAQTDSRLAVNGFMSITTKEPIGKKKRRGLLPTKRQKQKTELTIKCDPQVPKKHQRRTVSPSAGESSAPDSSLDTVDRLSYDENEAADQVPALEDDVSIIQDVITSEDQKWRTCTIQTDSESVVVNYITTSDVACNTDASLPGLNDDGYVSGSGDLTKGQGPKGGLFKPLNNVATETKKPAVEKAAKGKKQKQKKKKEPKQQVRPQETDTSSSSNLEAAPAQQQNSVADLEPTTERSISPSSKELKQRAKLERQEQLRKAKEEKRLQKEAEEAAAKAEKAKKKLEKQEAKKQSKSVAGKKSPTAEVSSSPEPSAADLKPDVAVSAPSVTFANDLIERETPSVSEQVLEPTLVAEEKSLPEDGRDIGRDSISGQEKPKQLSAEEVRTGVDEQLPASLGQEQKAETQVSELPSQQESLSELEQASTSQTAALSANLKPILKQQSASVDESSAEIVMSGPIATESESKPQESGEVKKVEDGPSKKDLAKLAKLKETEAKREAKLKEKEAKKLAKEAEKRAKEQKKAEEAEAKKLAAEAKKKKQKEQKSSSKSEELIVEPPAQEPASVAEISTATESKSDAVEPISESEPATETATAPTSSSFLGRLFGGAKGEDKKSKKPKKSKDKKSKATVDEPIVEAVAAAATVERAVAEDGKQEIMSEMYLSDPDDADGEMILEVNVPKQLLEKQDNSNPNEPLSLASDTVASPTRASTTIDETLATATFGDLPHPETASEDLTKANTLEQDQEATLVNTDEVDDEEATENVVSQAQDLTLDISSPIRLETSEAPEITEPLAQTDEISAPTVDEPQTSAATAEDATESSAPVVTDSSAKSKSDSKKEEKKRRELEAKLAKEAKKLEKAEAKLKKQQAKEEEARKKQEQKAAAGEAKRKAKEEKEKAKKEKKVAKKPSAGEQPATEHPAPAETEESVTPSIVVSGETKGEAQPEQSESAPFEDSLEGMTPVNTETELEKIVEEVMGDDGVLTRTTKTIETKYVTLQQETVQQCERQDMPADEYERIKRETEEPLQVADPEVAPTPLEAELEEIRAAPSCFGPDVVELKDQQMSPKKEQKKRIKLNQKLIRRALKLARSEKKHAQKCAKTAEAEIAVCDEAARRAQKELKHASKEAHKASKEAAKSHKKMDKVDKKLAKRQKKIEKRQRKLDKRAAKLAKEEAKKREKAAAKEAKLERKASKKSTKSLKLEDIGDPVLKSSSRLSVEPGTAFAGDFLEQQQRQQQVDSDEVVVAAEVSAPSTSNVEQQPARNDSPASDIQVEMSLDDSHPPFEPHSISEAQQPTQEVDEQPSAVEVESQPTKSGQIVEEEQPESVVLQEQSEPQLSAKDEPSESDEEIDVLEELPSISSKRQVAE